jgi:hypothetical protein
MNSQRTRMLLLLTLSFASVRLSDAQTQQNGNVARLVLWQAKPGMSRDLEEGYKRHLEWHRKNGDLWTWYGWTIISGDRFGYFVDGTFFHAWTDLDSPVSPAADAADNIVNVFPYGEVRSAAIYEAIPGLTNLAPQQLSSPLLTFCYFDVPPGQAAEFESLFGDELRNTQWSTVKHALLRPANGVTEYLLLLPAEKQSDLASQADLTSHLLHALARNTKATRVIDRFRAETARYRSDLSYMPNERPK